MFVRSISPTALSTATTPPPRTSGVCCTRRGSSRDPMRPGSSMSTSQRRPPLPASLRGSIGVTAMRVLFSARAAFVDGMAVDVSGLQHADGRIERSISIHPAERFTDEYLPAAQARGVAAALVEAADEIDYWAAVSGL